MIKCYTSEEIKKAEEYAVVYNGHSFIEMINNAATALYRYLSRFPSTTSVLILCGKGNNGADGYALCRLMRAAGYSVDLFSLENSSSTTENELFSSGLEASSELDHPEKYQLIIDCVFGFSFHGTLSKEYRALFTHLADCPGHRIAVDLPSGVNADTGEADPYSFKADTTLALGCYKPAHFAYPATAFCKEIVCLDIGLEYPQTASYHGINTLPHLPARFPRSNKGSYGTLCVIAGCKNMAGAGYLCAKAGYLSGVGLVKVVTPEENREIIQTLLPEAVLYTYTKETPPQEFLQATVGCSAVVLGPGLGESEKSKELVHYLLKNCILPLVLDADGLNLTVGSDLIKNYAGSVILTPHPGEASRLLGQSIEKILSSPLLYAKDLAQKNHAVVLLKDAHSVISATNQHYINLTGNDGMSTGGCGDVLAGIIGGLLAGGMTALDATVAGCYIHGSAGDIAAKKHGKRAMLASHVLECIEDVLRDS